MSTFFLISTIVLWCAVLFLGFLLLGTLRTIGMLTWRLEQFETTTPRKIGRDGLKKGTVAPEFNLPAVSGNHLSLHDYQGRQRLVVFSQLGCPPCHAIVPELNRLQRKGQVQVLVVLNCDLAGGREWVADTKACFPVGLQRDLEISRNYQVMTSPFAFYVNEAGIIAAKGIITSGHHINYLLSGADARPDHTVVIPIGESSAAGTPDADHVPENEVVDTAATH